MESPNVRKKISLGKYLKNKNDLQIQILEWDFSDVSVEDFNYFTEYEDTNENKLKYLPKQFLIHLFGTTEEGYSTTITVKNYKPYFFIEVPDNWKATQLEYLKNELEHLTSEWEMKNIYNFEYKKRYKFKWFNNYREFKYIKISFHNIRTFHKFSKLFETEKFNIKSLDLKDYKFNLYENNIPPVLKFQHDNKLTGCCWISVKKSAIYEYDEKLHRTQIDIYTSSKNIIYIDKNNIAPFTILSYDIEADSSHGDFPIPKKDYSKFSRELIDVYYMYFIDNYKENFEGIKNVKQKWLYYSLCHSLNISTTVKTMNDIPEEDYKIYTKWENEFDKYPIFRKMLNNISRIYYKKQEIKLSNISSIITNLIHIVDRIEKLSSIEAKKKKKLFINEFNKILYDEKNKKNILPKVEGDRVIQIGNVIQQFNKPETTQNVIFVLGTCDNIDNATVYSFTNEKELLLAWRKFIINIDPDIITGYNIFGFDYDFLNTRTIELGINSQFLDMSRSETKIGKFEIKKLASSALGENYLKFINMYGRISIDLLKVFQGDVANKLDSYKLDSVAELFLKENKDDVSPQEIFKLQKGDSSDRAIIAKYCIQDCNLVMRLMNKKKIIVNNIGMANVCLVPLSYLFMRGQGIKIYSLVANECSKMKYLIPLTKKSGGFIEETNNNKEITLENYEMEEFAEEFPESDNESETENEETSKKEIEQDESYEGAFVLNPKKGIYLEDGPAVFDYNSLYPSSMIERNISHDTIISIRNYDNNNKLIEEIGELTIEKDLLDGNIEGHTYIDVIYDNYKYTSGNKNGKALKKKVKEKCGYTIARYTQFPNEKKGILPSILQKLLKARKDTRTKAEFTTLTLKNPINNKDKIIGLKQKSNDKIKIRQENGEIIEIEPDNIISQEDTYDDFEKAVFDALQLAYKVVANSLYGQMGASTSPICWKVLAASTTATGRDRLLYAKDYIEKNYTNRSGIIVNVPEYINGTFTKKLYQRKIHCKEVDVIYGDTDSIFCKFSLYDEDTGKKIIGPETIPINMQMGIRIGPEVSKGLGKPQNLAFEKYIYPFILFTKKRYTGLYYENPDNPNDYHEKSMGIVLKRRDNAPIVKDMYKSVVDYIFNEKNVEGSIKMLQNNIKKMLAGGYPIDKFIITKTLKDRSAYANPDSIAHRVLADKMGERDPGNKPQSNDRIPFCYIKCNDIDSETGKKIKVLQGDKVEHPDYINENKLQLDYKFYLTNQIMKPIEQIYALHLENPTIVFSEFLEKKQISKNKLIKEPIKTNNKIIVYSTPEEIKEFINNKNNKNIELDKLREFAIKCNLELYTTENNKKRLKNRTELWKEIKSI